MKGYQFTSYAKKIKLGDEVFKKVQKHLYATLM